MNKFLNAARRDTAGIVRLYLHLFFRRKWYKPHGADLGHQALARLWPWVLGCATPFILGSVVAKAAQQGGVLSGICTALALLFLIWISYRAYRIFKPENSDPAGSHVRGAEVEDLSAEGEQK